MNGQTTSLVPMPAGPKPPVLWPCSLEDARRPDPADLPKFPERQAAWLYQQALDLWHLGQLGPAVTTARAALEWHVCAIAQREGRPARSYGGAIAVLKRLGLIDKHSAHVLNKLHTVGSRAAHGHPVSFDRGLHVVRVVGVVLKWWPRPAAVEVPPRLVRKPAPIGKERRFVPLVHAWMTRLRRSLRRLGGTP